MLVGVPPAPSTGPPFPAPAWDGEPSEDLLEHAVAEAKSAAETRTVATVRLLLILTPK